MATTKGTRVQMNDLNATDLDTQCLIVKRSANALGLLEK
jgi:hypothetical protein